MLAKRLLAVRRQAHHFAFIAILAVTDEFANHGVETAQRMRKEHTVENFDLIAFAPRHHRRNKIARAVVAEPSGLFPRRAVVRAGDVGDVVLEVMLLKTKLRGIDIQGLQQKGAHIAHGFFALAKTNKVQNLGRIRKRVLYFPGQVRVAVLADRYVFDVRDFGSNGFEARLHRECGKPPKCLRRLRRSSAMANFTSPSSTMAAEASA